MTTQIAINWQKTKFDQLAQEDPRSSMKWLPSTTYTTKAAVYQDYKKEATHNADITLNSQKQVVTYSYFIKLWNTHFSNVTFPRNNPFARCDLCDMLDKAIAMCTARCQGEHSVGLKALQGARERHVGKQSLDRTHYHSKRWVILTN